MAKKNPVEVVPEVAELVEEEIEVAPEVVVLKEPAGPTAGRKALGGKEVIPFKWKLIGKSGDYTITLFKSVEREDSDGQLDRLRKEGYYTELQVVDVDTKVEQPKPPRSASKTTAGAKKGAPVPAPANRSSKAKSVVMVKFALSEKKAAEKKTVKSARPEKKKRSPAKPAKKATRKS